jgi:hypothetical protein
VNAAASSDPQDDLRSDLRIEAEPNGCERKGVTFTIFSVVEVGGRRRGVTARQR